MTTKGSGGMSGVDVAEVDELRARVELLESVIDALPTAIFVKDEAHRLVVVNRKFAEFVGRPVQELLGSTVRDALSTDQFQDFLDRDDRVLATGQLEDHIEKRLDAMGQTRTVNTRKARLVLQERELVVGTLRDLTDVASRAARSEADLRSAMAALEQVTALISVGIVHLDSAGRFAYAYGPDLRAMGITADKVGGTHFTALSALWPELIPLLSGALGGQLQAAVLEWRGRARHVMVAPTRDAEGQLDGATLVSVDLTAQRDAERRRARGLRMDSLVRLAGGVAHDLNNLLSIVMMGTSVLRDALAAGDTSAALSQVRLIERSTERGARLSRQLASFARRQVGPPQVVDLHEQVRPVEVFLESLVGADVELDFHLCDDAPRVRLAPGQIEQLLINLVLHAAAGPGRGKVQIETSCVHLADDPELRDGEYVAIRVADRGPKLAPADRERLFEPFFDPDGRGSNMGLATCYGIAVQAGGRIRALVGDSGNLSEVLLPRTAEPPSMDADFEQVRAPARRGLRILLAEDENVLRSQLSQLLVTAGHKVVLAAENGQQALEFFREHSEQVDIVLSDIVMPRLSGVDLALEIEGQVPIVLMSGFVADSLNKVADLGVRFQVLMKPVRPDELLHALQHELLHNEQR